MSDSFDEWNYSQYAENSGQIYSNPPSENGSLINSISNSHGQYNRNRNHRFPIAAIDVMNNNRSATFDISNSNGINIRGRSSTSSSRVVRHHRRRTNLVGNRMGQLQHRGMISSSPSSPSTR